MSDSFFDHGQNDNEFTAKKGGIPNLDGAENDQGRITEDRRMVALMAYIPFLCFVPLLRMRDDKYAKFHARQGLVLFLFELIVFVFSFEKLNAIFWTAITIGCIGAAVAGIMFAVQGKYYKIPVIGDIAERFRL